MSASLAPWKVKAQAGEDISRLTVYKQFVPDQIKIAKDDSRQVTFVISTGAVDREGDTIAVEGWDVENYLRNPVVLWAHRYDQLPVAKAVSVVKSAGQLKATAEFPEPGLNPMADTVYEMLRGGFLRATSVGFRPKKSVHNEERPGWAMDFIEQELLEFSVVPVPANPEALMETAKGLAGALAAGIDIAPLEQALALAKSVTKDFAPKPEAKAEAAPAPDTARLEVKLDATCVSEIVDKAVADLRAELKSGRTFSAANAERIRKAHECGTQALTHLQELVDQCPMEPMDDDDEDDDKATAPANRLEHLRERTDPEGLKAEPADTTYVMTAADLTALVGVAVSKARAGAAARGKE